MEDLYLHTVDSSYNDTVYNDNLSIAIEGVFA